MSDELKACPFCGGNNLAAYLSSQGSSVVYCINCYEDNNGLSRDIAGWNTRPIEDALQARITELKETIEDIKELAELALVDAKTLQSALFHLSTIGIIANKAVKESENE